MGYSHAGTNLIQTSHLAIEKTKAQKVCLKSQVRCVAMSLVLCQLLGTDDLDKHHQERGNAGVYCITWLALQGQVPEPKSSIISKLLLQSFNFLGISLIVSWRLPYSNHLIFTFRHPRNLVFPGFLPSVTIAELDHKPTDKTHHLPKGKNLIWQASPNHGSPCGAAPPSLNKRPWVT